MTAPATETALNERYFAEDVFTHWRLLPRKTGSPTAREERSDGA